ncbi:MAG: class I SAM-dependent methyltransferase [Verrucomicrobiaceae bacterium]|nr:class I SAM-dependent methyltransferase [Verrucomicrobiaceae bacterium]
MNPLDQYTSQYRDGAVTGIENELILNWYPNRILKRLQNSANASLLELGLGHGFSTLQFNPHFNQHMVIDGSPEVISLFNAKHCLDSLEIVESYFENFQTERRFDVIVMGFILEHVDDPGLIVRKYRDFLNPGGRMFIAVPNAKSLNRRLGVALGKIDNIYDLNANDLLLGHKRQFCADTLKKLMLDNGYEVPWTEGIYLKPLPLHVLQTMPDFKENLQAMCEVGVDFPELCVGLLLEATCP